MARLAAFAGVWLALFALLFTIGSSLEIWPRLSPAALRGTDLAAGAAAAVALLWLFLGRARSARK